MDKVLHIFAQIDPNTVGVPVVDENTLLWNALNTTYFIAGIIAVIVIILAGISYASSGGDASKVTKAKNQILFSIVGLILVISAFVLTNFIIGSF